MISVYIGVHFSMLFNAAAVLELCSLLETNPDELERAINTSHHFKKFTLGSIVYIGRASLDMIHIHDHPNTFTAFGLQELPPILDPAYIINVNIDI